MAGTIIDLVLLSIVLLAAVLCALAPVGFMGIMFWRWHRELARLRQAGTVQPTAVLKTVSTSHLIPSLSPEGAARLDRLAS